MPLGKCRLQKMKLMMMMLMQHEQDVEVAGARGNDEVAEFEAVIVAAAADDYGDYDAVECLEEADGSTVPEHEDEKGWSLLS